jgi:hypothetical protein
MVLISEIWIEYVQLIAMDYDVTYQKILRCSVLINEIWIEYVELIALDYFWRRVVHIIVGLIILIPLKPSVHPATYTHTVSSNRSRSSSRRQSQAVMSI